MLPVFKKEGGIFMTDSGAFSFMGKFSNDSHEIERMTEEEFWLPYLEEYLKWVKTIRSIFLVLPILTLIR